MKHQDINQEKDAIANSIKKKRWPVYLKTKLTSHMET